MSTSSWNLIWALGYNVIGLGLAAAGWLHPVIAAIAMGLSGLFVVLNSLALGRFETHSTHDDAPADRAAVVAAIPQAAVTGSAP